MKLEDLLAKYLVEWPDNTLWVAQGPDGKIYNNNGSVILYSTFEDCIDAYAVTQMQYLAARDRLHAETVKEANIQATKEARAIAQGHGKVFSSMESMTASLTEAKPKPTEWLEIAKDQFHIITKSKTCRDTLSFAQAAEFAFDAADAFCAEMNKRITS